jgi:hypothetical protein
MWEGGREEGERKAGREEGREVEDLLFISSEPTEPLLYPPRTFMYAFSGK